MDTHILGPVPGCLKMTTIDPQHYLETGDIPRVAGLIEFNVDWRCNTWEMSNRSSRAFKRPCVLF